MPVCCYLHLVSCSNSETDVPILASISRVSVIRHERSAVLCLECERRMIRARRALWQSLREMADSENASSEMVRERYGEARGKEVSGLELRRTHRRCCPSTTPVADGCHLFPCRGIACSIMVQAMTCFLFSLWSLPSFPCVC